MHEFKTQQVEWPISVSIGGVLRVQEKLKVNLLDMTASAADLAADGKTEPLVVTLTTRPDVFSSVLWLMVQPLADERTTSQAAFYESLDGAAYGAAYDAFFEEMIDFFQQSGLPEQADLVKKQLTLVKSWHEMASEKVDSLDVERLMGRAKERTRGMDLNAAVEREVDAMATRGETMFGSPPES